MFVFLIKYLSKNIKKDDIKKLTACEMQEQYFVMYRWSLMLPGKKLNLEERVRTTRKKYGGGGVVGENSCVESGIPTPRFY